MEVHLDGQDKCFRNCHRLLDGTTLLELMNHKAVVLSLSITSSDWQLRLDSVFGTAQGLVLGQIQRILIRTTAVANPSGLILPPVQSPMRLLLSLVTALNESLPPSGTVRRGRQLFRLPSVFINPVLLSHMRLCLDVLWLYLVLLVRVMFSIASGMDRRGRASKLGFHLEPYPRSTGFRSSLIRHRIDWCWVLS